MTTTNDLTAMEGIDINCSYEMICIDRLNTKVNAIPSADPTLRTDLNANIVQTNKLKSYIVFNVKEYGAIGDGTTDDTQSIKNAIAAFGLTLYVMLYFPQGTYKLTSEVNINERNFLHIKSDNAFLHTYHNETTLSFTNSDYITFEGNLSFYCQPAFGNLTTTPALKFTNCTNCKVNNINIFGTYYIGLQFRNVLYGVCASIISQVYVADSQIGIRIMGEYIEVTNCICKSCVNYGLLIQAGNVNITGGQYIYNRIGILINALESTNADHGSITGALINHNSKCGILLMNVVHSYIITNCNIWLSNDPSTNGLPEVTKINGKNSAHNIYLENVINTIITNNVISGGRSNITMDGWAKCIISNNYFKCYPDQNNYNLWEIGEANTTYNRNIDNIITNNMTNGSLISGSSWIHFVASYNNRKFLIKDNRGDLLLSYKLINVASTDHYIYTSDEYVIDANVVGATGPIDPTNGDPNSQSTNIYIFPCLIGECVNINFINTGKWVWIKLATDNTTNYAVIASSGAGTGIGQFFPAKKAILFNTSLCHNAKFTPINGEPNGWLVQSIC